MSMKLSKSFCGKNTATAFIAASIALTALHAANAQSSADSNNSSAATGGAASSSTTAAASAAPLPGDNSSSASSSAADGSAAGTAASTTAAPTSDIPPGVLWTDPKYAVKEVPQPKTQSTKQPSPATAADIAAHAAASSTAYDEIAAKVFADAVSQPQYVWNQADSKKKGKTSVANVSKELAAYNRTIVEKFVANMTVPDGSTLVENSSAMYVYLMSFSVDAKGNISKIKSESTFGPFTALHLADDGENSKMTAGVVQALSKCSPLPKPPAGTPPWYMLLRYEPNTGKVFVANLNTI